MKKLTDQELDSVFKNAAEGHEPAFDQTAWEALNTKLDQPRPTRWKRWMPYALLGLLIFSAGVWLGTQLPITSTASLSQARSGQTEINQADKFIGFQEDIRYSQNQEGKYPDPAKTQVDNSNPILSTPDNESSPHMIQLVTGNQKKNNDVIIAEESSASIDEITIVLPDKKNHASDNELNTQHLLDSIQQNVHNDQKEKNSNEPEDENEKIELIEVKSFYIRLNASPDFSSINYSPANSTGSNYALLLDYQLTDRWSISTGGIWSVKKYATDEKFTYGKYTADRMSGNCRILDIPLNIYYRFLPKARTSFYAGVGFSSYIMLEEEYTYTFDFPAGSRDFTGYIEKENNEWFKMLNISLGVQYRIAQRFHLQIEPFLKAPLTGIGEWDVRLSSMGVFMGLKYKIN